MRKWGGQYAGISAAILSGAVNSFESLRYDIVPAVFIAATLKSSRLLREIITAASGAQLQTEIFYCCGTHDVINVALIYASEAESKSCMRYLLSAGADVNYAGPKGETALSAASKAGALWSVQFLLELGALISRGVLLAAVEHTCVLRLLIEAGARVDSMGPALNFAARKGYAHSVRALLLAGANPDAPGYCGVTPLMNAVKGGRLACALLLLDAGAKIDARDDSGNDAILYSISYWNGETDMAHLLLRHATAESTTATWFTRGQQGGRTALHLIAELGILGVARAFVQKGWSLDATDEELLTPLVYAMQSPDVVLEFIQISGPETIGLALYRILHIYNRVGMEGAVKLLIDAGPSKDVYNYLHVALRYGTVLDVGLLLDSGADASQAVTFAAKHASLDKFMLVMRNSNPSPEGQPLALHAAATRDEPMFVRELLSAGWKRDALDGEGRTPLAVAAEHGRHAAFAELFRAEDIGLRVGGRPLMLLAAERGNFYIVQHFLVAGAGADDGVTASLVEAARGGNVDLANLLLSFGADPNSEHDSTTPLAACLRVADWRNVRPYWFRDMATQLVDAGADPRRRAYSEIPDRAGTLAARQIVIDAARNRLRTLEEIHLAAADALESSLRGAQMNARSERLARALNVSWDAIDRGPTLSALYLASVAAGRLHGGSHFYMEKIVLHLSASRADNRAFGSRWLALAALDRLNQLRRAAVFAGTSMAAEPGALSRLLHRQREYVDGIEPVADAADGASE